MCLIVPALALAAYTALLYLLVRSDLTPNLKICCNFSAIHLSIVKPCTTGKLLLGAFQKCTVLPCLDEYHKSYRPFYCVFVRFPEKHLHKWFNTNRKTIVYSLLSCEYFFARTYNLHVKIDHSPVIRKIDCNFRGTHLSMVKLYIFGKLWVRAFQWCMVLLWSDE